MKSYTFPLISSIFISISKGWTWNLCWFLTDLENPLFQVSPLGFPYILLLPMFCFPVFLLETQESSWNCIHPYFCRVPYSWGHSWIKEEKEEGDKNNRISLHSLDHGVPFSQFLWTVRHRCSPGVLGDCAVVTTDTVTRTGNEEEKVKNKTKPKQSLLHTLMLTRVPLPGPPTRKMGFLSEVCSALSLHSEAPWITVGDRRGKACCTR